MSSAARRGSRSSAQARRRVRRWCIPTSRRCASRAAKELPPELLALAAAHGITVTRVSVRNQRSRWGACSATRLDHAQLAADPRAGVRARVRDDSRADASARAESLEAVLAARRRGVPAATRRPAGGCWPKASAVYRAGDLLMKRSVMLVLASVRGDRGGRGRGARADEHGHVQGLLDRSRRRRHRRRRHQRAHGGRRRRSSVQESNGWGAEIRFRPLDRRRRRHAAARRLTSYMVNAGWVKPDRQPPAVRGASAPASCRSTAADRRAASSARTYDLGMSVGGGAFVAVTRLRRRCAPTRATSSPAPIIPTSVVPTTSLLARSVGATFMWAIVP